MHKDNGKNVKEKKRKSKKDGTKVLKTKSTNIISPMKRSVSIDSKATTHKEKSKSRSKSTNDSKPKYGAPFRQTSDGTFDLSNDNILIFDARCTKPPSIQVTGYPDLSSGWIWNPRSKHYNDLAKFGGTRVINKDGKIGEVSQGNNIYLRNSSRKKKQLFHFIKCEKDGTLGDTQWYVKNTITNEKVSASSFNFDKMKNARMFICYLMPIMSLCLFTLCLLILMSVCLCF